MSNSTKTTLDDTSSFLTYGGGAWGTNHTNDAETVNYWNATFHTSTIAKAWVRLCWSGTDITVFGAKRNNHGLYAVVVDNGDVNWHNGYSSADQIQAVLHASDGLEQGTHQIVIYNEHNVNSTTGRLWLDVDYIDFIGTAINCSSLPNATVTPTGTIAYITSTTASAVTTTQPESSTVTIAVSSSVQSSTDEASTTEVKATTVDSTSAASSTTAVSSTTVNATVITSTRSSLTNTSISSASSSTSSITRPTTTITLDRPNISTSPYPSITGISEAANSSSSGAGRMTIGVEQVALFGLLGFFLKRMLLGR